MSKDFSFSFNAPGALFIVFLILKLMNIIHWSWWWVTAPLWAPVAIVLIIAIIIAGVTEWKS